MKILLKAKGLVVSRTEFQEESQEKKRYCAQELVDEFGIQDYLLLKTLVAAQIKSQLPAASKESNVLLHCAINFLSKCDTETLGSKIKMVMVSVLLSEKNLLDLQHITIISENKIPFTELTNAELKPIFHDLKEKALSFYAEVRGSLFPVPDETYLAQIAAGIKCVKESAKEIYDTIRYNPKVEEAATVLQNATETVKNGAYVAATEAQRLFHSMRPVASQVTTHDQEKGVPLTRELDT